MLTDQELTNLIREVVDIVSSAEPGPTLDLQVEKLKNAGIRSDIHVGKNPAMFTHRMTLEWYAGSFLSIIEEKAWYAMNSWLNSVDRFAPKE